MNTRTIFASLVIILLLVIAFYFTKTEVYSPVIVNNQEEVVIEPQVEEIPPVEEIVLPPDDKSNLIIVDYPQAGGLITSPLTFSGQARGTWFFEASFPVFLVNWDGLIIAQGIAQATEDWMTEEFVPFTGSLEFEMPDYGDNGALIFQKDNPSGLPEFDDALEIPILFK